MLYVITDSGNAVNGNSIDVTTSTHRLRVLPERAGLDRRPALLALLPGGYSEVA